MATLLFMCLLLGAGLATAGGLVLGVATLAQYLDERKERGGGERRKFTRVPCHFRTVSGPATEAFPGDLSLGGACVVLPEATLGRRLKVVALDQQGFAEAAVIEGRVVAVQRRNGNFVHHLAFDPGEPSVTVAALVAAGAVG